MPRAPFYIRVPAVIRKSDIALTVELGGKANDAVLLLDGKAHAPGSVRYAHFEGSRQDDGLYHGEHCFEPGDWKDAVTADLSQLFHTKTAKPKGATSDGIQPHDHDSR